MIHNLKAVLFDLDGVLIDACGWHYESLNRALLETVGFQITYEDHVTTYNGLPTKIKLQMLKIIGKDFDQVMSLKQLYTIEEIKKNSKVMKEKVELHSFLKKNQVKIACVTNSIKSNTELMLSSTGQLDFFDLIVSNEDVINNKPSPDCYNLAIDRLGVLPTHTICVEDSDKGYQAAKNSKASFVWRVANTEEVTLQNLMRLKL